MVASIDNLSGQVVESACDTVLTDFSPGSSNAPLFRNLHEERPQLKIILSGMEDDPETFLKAIHLGASGYVLEGSLCAGDRCGRSGGWEEGKLYVPQFVHGAD